MLLSKQDASKDEATKSPIVGDKSSWMPAKTNRVGVMDNKESKRKHVRKESEEIKLTTQQRKIIQTSNVKDSLI